MGIIKKFYYCFIKRKYRLCNLCKGVGAVITIGYSPNELYEDKYFSSCVGEIYIKCPACDKSGIIWG
jgi:hypothetical protein